MLCIAYAANIGGTMTLIGTPPNIVMAGYLKEILDYEIQFVQWLGIGLSVGITLFDPDLFFTHQSAFSK